MTTALAHSASSEDPAARYLGPARAVQCEAQRVKVVLEDGSVKEATPALAFPYRCAAGDKLLVVGEANRFYVIGVMAGRGQSKLSADGSLRLATDGQLKLRGDRGVRISTPAVAMKADELLTVATEAVQTFEHQTRQIHHEQRTEAGQIDDVSESSWLLRARRVILKTLEKARIKSNTVRLG